MEDKKEMVRLTFLLQPHLRDFIQKKANERESTAGSVMRLWVREHYEQEVTPYGNSTETTVDLDR